MLVPVSRWSQKIHYDVFDCTSSLVGGGIVNIFATTLGRGWWALPLDAHTRVLGYEPFGNRMVRVLVTAQLEEARTGKISSFRWGSGMSGEWKHSEGPIVSDHLFLGEVYDARKAMVGWRMRDYDDSNWAPLATTTFPYNKTAKMVSLMIPPITRRASFTPVAVTKSNQGWVFDLGVNMAGSCTLRINDASGIASPGDEVTMRHAEAVGPGGELIQTWLLGGAEQSKYIIRANSNSNAASEVWTPSFSYFGFRFVEVVGYPQTADAPPPRDALECHFMHTSFSHASTFRAIGPTPSSAAAATINAIQQAVLNSARANFYSHPTVSNARTSHCEETRS